jgi:hypothetical protein
MSYAGGDRFLAYSAQHASKYAERAHQSEKLMQIFTFKGDVLNRLHCPTIVSILALLQRVNLNTKSD